MARIAKSLETLRRQIDEIYPNRSKVSDGWLGDSAHAARKSDHNPNSAGVVQAFDITHDPRPGIGPDVDKLAEILRQNKDHRIKYVIRDEKIFSSEKAPWTWRAYNGPNPHKTHMHVSVSDDPSLYDDGAEWDLTIGDDPSVPVENPAAASPDALRASMARHIISYEDAGVRLKVSHLDDGTIEVAGVNSRYHAPEANALKTLVNAGKDAEARQRAAEYIIRYTDPVREWTKNPAIEFNLRDAFFNRGPSGAGYIIQKAVGVAEDGRVGPATRAALTAAETDPRALLGRLRVAREQYERNPPPNAGFPPRDESSASWRGLVNRWNKVYDTAVTLLPAPMPTPPPPQPEPSPVPQPPPPPIVPPPTPLPGGGTFIENVERLVAQITAEKDEAARAFARLKELSAELARLTDRGL